MKKSFHIDYDRYSGALINNRTKILTLTIILTCFAIYFLPDLRVKNNSAKFLPGGENQVIKSQKLFDTLFNSTDYIYLLVESDSSPGNSLFNDINTISKKIKKLNGVKGVFSITDAERIEWMNVLGDLIPVSVPAGIPGNSDTASYFNFIRNSGIYTGNVVTDDFKYFNIIINVEKPDIFQENEKLIDSVAAGIKNIISEYPPGKLKFYLAGAPLFDNELSETVRKDLKIFIPLSILISLLILLVTVRETYLIILVITVALISLTWSLALISISGTPMSVGLTVVIPLIIMINTAYSLHYIYHYRALSTKYNNIKDVLSTTFQELLVPSFTAGLTTALGFFSLTTSSFEGIREIGFYIGTAILLSTLVINMILPALLSYKRNLPSRETVFLKSFLYRMCSITIRHHKLILLLFLGVLLGALYGFVNMKTDTNLLNYISSEHQLRKSFNKIDSVFGGTLPLELIVQSPYDEAGENLLFIDALSEGIRSEKLAGSIISINDLLKFIDKSRPEKDISGSVPFSFDTRNYPSSFWRSLAKSKQGRNFISLRDSTIYFKVSCRIKSAGSDELSSLLKRVKLYTEKGNNNKIIVAGIVPFFVESNRLIIGSQVRSFIIAFIIILLFFFMFTRSIKIGFVSLIPNIYPIIFTIGLLGIFNIPLDLSNMMIASIAIGIIVDDTIHFIYNYQKGKNLPASKKIEIVYDSISQPVFATSLIVAAGFFVLGFSDFQPTKYFGILSGMLIFTALAADLMLFPSLLIYFDRD